MKTLNLAILGSTHGTVMMGLLDAIAQGQLPAQIQVVISNKEDAPILTRAREHQLEAIFIDPAGLSREEYDQQLSEKMKEKNVDLILLIGYMRILTKQFVQQWPQRVMNIHPSLLPEFAGRMDQDVHQAVLNAKKTETGCTVHYVTEQIDEGPIVLQKHCIVAAHDNVESLKARVQALEKEALIEAIIHYNSTDLDNH